MRRKRTRLRIREKQETDEGRKGGERGMRDEEENCEG